MPRISDFYGIAIFIYYEDHAPPHFHAIYGEHEVAMEIATGAVLAGQLPRRARLMVEEWMLIHRCKSCGQLHENRIAGDDSVMLLLAIAAKPLANPPVPLEFLS